jgi:N-acyl homoserine lactone hydrolase
MKLSAWALLAGTIPLAIGAGLVARDLLPERWAVPPDADEASIEGPQNAANLPAVEVTFLRCGFTTVPELVAVRGGWLKRVTIAHSAVLIRHPQATFLYDTGMCAEIRSYLVHQSLAFRQTLGRFALERSLGVHLRHLGLAPSDLQFALLSHLHWDHVGGVPDLPGVPLRINRVEYEAAQRAPLNAKQGFLNAKQDLVCELMRDNPIELFDTTGPAYEGFSSSYDLFGDGALVLAPLPGHTAGNTGMFVNRSNGPRLLLIGDAAHVAANYIRPATMHPVLWTAVTSDDATARRTLLALHRFSRRRPDVVLIAMHDATTQAMVQALHASLA